MTAHLELEKRALHLAGARLLVLRGPDRGRALRMDKEEISIGAAPSCDLRLTDPTVSRHHLSLRALPQGYLATDLQTTNGTFLLGRRIQAAYLEPGDTLDLGTTRIRLEALPHRLELPLHEAPRFGRMIGRSAESRRLFAMLETVAHQEVPVLLLGETGTGKQLAARSIHEVGSRAGRPFVTLDCSAVAPDLMTEQGFVEAAERAPGGTLFLDEVDALPEPSQPGLLRLLEDGELDVRLLAASRSDLRMEVNRGVFREDLFYRLNAVSIRLPPLRERADDIALLATHFHREVTQDPEAVLPPSRLKPLLLRSWPGNVRELRNLIARSALLAASENPEPPSDDPDESYASAKAQALAVFERRFLSGLLLRTEGNVTQAARLARMDRVNLLRLLRKYKIPRRP